ncbi:MAG: SurA N-terminal domain-containing protein [Rhizobiales bacterium]|nr:SurA N-terminal domain-containing protein [Hyphomicrobiales bacterium]
MTLLRAIALAVVVLAAAGLQTPAHAQSIVAIVNGEAITNTDIEQRIKLTQLTAKKTITRQEALDELINDKVKIKEGKKYGLDLSAADIDSAYANMASRMRMNDEQLSKTLENNGIRPQTLKARMKADMTWGNLVRGRFNSTLTPADKDLRAAMGEKEGDDKTSAESFEYKMRPIVLVVPRGAAPSAVELRRKEAELLRQRIDGCDQATEFFRSMRDAAIRDQVVKTSADLSAPLRELLDKTPIGKLTPPEITKQGIEMVALCGRDSTKTDTPAKRALKEKIYSERYEAKSKSYLQEIRKGAMIEMR